MKKGIYFSVLSILLMGPLLLPAPAFAVSAYAVPAPAAGAVGTRIPLGRGLGEFPFASAFDLLAFGLVTLAAAGGLVSVRRRLERRSTSFSDIPAIIGLGILSILAAALGALAVIGAAAWWLVERAYGRKGRRGNRGARVPRG